jgi:hypothetical protein
MRSPKFRRQRRILNDAAVDIGKVGAWDNSSVGLDSEECAGNISRGRHAWQGKIAARSLLNNGFS